MALKELVGPTSWMLVLSEAMGVLMTGVLCLSVTKPQH